MPDWKKPNTATQSLIESARCLGIAQAENPDAIPYWEKQVEKYQAMVADNRPAPESFQQRVAPWMQECFGPEISADVVERCDRYTEESLELVQSLGYTRDRVDIIADYVFSRPLGEPAQEVGGARVTLAALCLAVGLNQDECAETELARIWGKISAIRAKQATKPKNSPLPQPDQAQNK